MIPPSTTLKEAIDLLNRARVKLDDTMFLCNDRNATMADIRILFGCRDQVAQAVTDLDPALQRIRRLSARAKA